MKVYLEKRNKKRKQQNKKNEIYITSDLHFNFKINMLGLLSREKGLHQYNLCCFSLDGYIDISAMLNFWFALNYINPCQLNLSLHLIWYICYVLCEFTENWKYQIRHSLFLLLTKHTIFFYQQWNKDTFVEGVFELYYKLLK